MNQKGLLPEETLKLVIGVLCLAFLAVFLYYLYYSQKSSNDAEKAEASLQKLIAKINAGETHAEVYEPAGWAIASWAPDEVLPNKCSSRGWESCICICERTKTSGGVKPAAETCDLADAEICAQSDFFVKGTPTDTMASNSIMIENPPTFLSIDHDKKIIELESVEFSAARDSLKYLIDKIKSGAREIQISKPAGWALIGWSSEKGIMPKSCSLKNWKRCLCICKLPSVATVPDACDNEGICFESEFKVEGEGPIKNIKPIVIEIKPPLNLLIDQENKKITLK